MLAIRELVQNEIDRLRKEGELLKSQAKERFQKADELEKQLAQIPLQGTTQLDIGKQPKMERGSRAEIVVRIMDENPSEVFTPEILQMRLGYKIDPGLLSRLKKDGRISKAKIAGYCSTNAPEALKEEQDSDPQLYSFLGEQMTG